MRITREIAIVAALLLVVACGGDGDDNDGGSGIEEETVDFDEGSILMDIEFLDTGLLKGRAYVNAADGWNVEGVDVRAVLENGTEWGVIEIPETSDADSTTFFEVQVGELPRGQQVSLSTAVTFAGNDGATIQRTVTDQWPP
jgi:hypothetical protein